MKYALFPLPVLGHRNCMDVFSLCDRIVNYEMSHSDFQNALSRSIWKAILHFPPSLKWITCSIFCGHGKSDWFELVPSLEHKPEPPVMICRCLECWWFLEQDMSSRFLLFQRREWKSYANFICCMCVIMVPGFHLYRGNQGIGKAFEKLWFTKRVRPSIAVLDIPDCFGMKHVILLFTTPLRQIIWRYSKSSRFPSLLSYYCSFGYVLRNVGTWYFCIYAFWM